MYVCYTLYVIPIYLIDISCIIIYVIFMVIILIIWFFLRDVGMEVQKTIQTRCRDSINTKFNIHSPIPTSFLHVNCNVNNSTKAMNT